MQESKQCSFVTMAESLSNVFSPLLTLSVMCTKTDRPTFAISVDPDEMAHNEPSHLDLHCLPK